MTIFQRQFPAPAFDRAATKALTGVCFFLLLLVLLIPHSAFAIPHIGKRLSSAVYSGAGGGTVNYTSYDGNANLLALNENGTNGITRTFDGLNRVTSYTFGGNTIGYRYYPSGKLAKLVQCRPTGARWRDPIKQ